MPRPQKKRRICAMPEFSAFAPCHRHEEAEIVEMTVDEYETIRLIDLMGCTQEDCSKQMEIARTTVQAIYDSARKKLADVLINGKRLEISGGHYRVCPHSGQCCAGTCAKRENRYGQCCEAADMTASNTTASSRKER